MNDTNLRVLDAEPPCADTISTLEDALACAKTGEISSVAIALVYRDGNAGRCWSNAPSLSCLIGSVERLKYAIIRFSEEQ